MPSPKASLVICTTRPDAYATLMRSLHDQTEQDFEVITIDERGPLARLRNQGVARAQASVVCVIDDDTVCPPGWLAGVLDTFRRYPDVVGVSGPAIIPGEFRSNRQLFRSQLLTWGYERLFVDHPNVPGHVSQSGAVTLASASPTCAYEGPVDYLEACNMSWRTAALRGIGGFDEAYGDLGEWSEPDVAYRLRRHLVGTCHFTPAAALYHCPSRGGATVRRKSTRSRLDNLRLFHARWVPDTWRSRAYRAFVATYFAALEAGVLKP